MNPKIEELLKLLANEQGLRDYLYGNLFMAPNDDWGDLAFRLRDEAVKECRANWRQAQHLVVSAAAEAGQAPPLALPETWWADFAQPEHYIVAALIAQELQKETKT